MDLKIITFESEAFFALVDEIEQRLGSKKPDSHIGEVETMRLLGIKSKSHLWKLRTELKIDFFQDDDHPKQIMYCQESIKRYLKMHTKRSEL